MEADPDGCQFRQPSRHLLPRQPRHRESYRCLSLEVAKVCPAGFRLRPVMVSFQSKVFVTDAFLFQHRACQKADCQRVTGSRPRRSMDEFRRRDVLIRSTARDRRWAAYPLTGGKYRHPKDTRRKKRRVLPRLIEKNLRHHRDCCCHQDCSQSARRNSSRLESNPLLRSFLPKRRRHRGYNSRYSYLASNSRRRPGKSFHPRLRARRPRRRVLHPRRRVLRHRGRTQG